MAERRRLIYWGEGFGEFDERRFLSENPNIC